jgi:hypothetical protein
MSVGSVGFLNRAWQVLRQSHAWSAPDQPKPPQPQVRAQGAVRWPHPACRLRPAASGRTAVDSIGVAPSPGSSTLVRPARPHYPGPSTGDPRREGGVPLRIGHRASGYREVAGSEGSLRKAAARAAPGTDERLP